MAVVPEDQDPLLNVVLGGARIQRRVSAGLLANVYLGLYERLNVPVAVKVLSPKAIAQGMSKDRFVREGRALAQLSHPNVIKIYNVGHDNGRYFIVMDWIQDGMNLRQLAQSRPLTPAQSLKVARRLCEAIEYIHSKSLIHRDIKPANICLRKGGHPVVMDFSLIKDQSSDVQLTAPGTIMGTVNFMPPEQAQPGGPFGAVGPWSDVYSVGATLYWLLTGRPPFKGKTPMETIVKLIREAHVPPSQINPTVPPAVDALLARTLAKRPEERPQTARELMAAIDELAAANAEALSRGVPPPIASDEDAGIAPAPAAAPAAAPTRSWGAAAAQAPSAPAPAPAAEAPAMAPARNTSRVPVGAVAPTFAAQEAQPYAAPPYAAPQAAPPYGAPAAQPYGAPALAYGAPQAYAAPPAAQPYAAPVAQPYAAPPVAQPHGAPPAAQPWGAAPVAPATPDDVETAKIPPPARSAAPRSWVEETRPGPSWAEQTKERAASTLAMTDDPKSASADANAGSPAPVAATNPASDSDVQLPQFSKREQGKSRGLEIALIIGGILFVTFCVGLGIVLLVTRGGP